MQLGLLTAWCWILRGCVPIPRARVSRGRKRKPPGQLRATPGTSIDSFPSYFVGQESQGLTRFKGVKTDLMDEWQVTLQKTM